MSLSQALTIALRISTTYRFADAQAINLSPIGLTHD